MLMKTRRAFLQGLAAGVPIAASLQSIASGAAETLQPWSKGFLDIHHISTGRGSCAFLLGPDGTTFMVDCGSIVLHPDTAQYIISPKPDGSRRPAEWVARYVERQMKHTGRVAIDSFISTHFHSDHFGDIGPDSPKSKFGNYQLGGISDLAETVPVHRVLDRGYPDYAYPVPADEPQQLNYRAFVNSLIQRGGTAERFHPGSATQLRLLREPAAFPQFQVRNLVANGELWTGVGETTRQQFPSLSALERRDYPTENMCSLGFRLSYGRFDYFTAGDMCHDTNYGSQPWRDIETPVAQVAGPVDVAVANHHGYVDATGPGFVAALRPRCFVINAWDSAHPAMPAMNNMLSQELYPGERDIFATATKPESKIALRQLAYVASGNGHVVIRVHPGGATYEVIITENMDESDRILKRFGPYSSR